MSLAKRRLKRMGPAASALLLATFPLWVWADTPAEDTPPARILLPVEQWSSGDWWEVQLEQPPLHWTTAPMNGPMNWIPSFLLRFRVTHLDEKEARVEVTTIPASSLQERLVLSYTPQGALISAQVIDAKLVEPLGPAGSPGLFGMLGREAFDLSKAPLETKAEPAEEPAQAAPAKADDGRLVPVAMDAGGRSRQTWEAGDCFWRRFETSEGMPQRATLIRGSWRKRAPTGEKEKR